MARIRTIKPTFWEDSKLAKLSRDCRLLYIGLWNVCDDYGVCIADPVWLKARILPYDDKIDSQFRGWLQSLEGMDRLRRFEHNGEWYYYLPKFLEHQKIDHPSKTRHPKPTREVLEGSASPRESLAQEGIGKVGEGRVEEGRVAIPIPAREILEDLNRKLGKPEGRGFKLTTKVHELIAARSAEGFTPEDFFAVHDKKIAEWINGEMAKFLRPETLYSNKFNSYLNAPVGVDAAPKSTRTVQAALKFAGKE